MLPLRYARAWQFLGWVGVAIALVASLWPGGFPLPVTLWDKLEHSSGYALMTLWFAGLYPRTKLWRVGIACFLLGVLIELLQGLTPTRTSDAADALANGVGIAVALGFAYAGLWGWAQRVERLAGVGPSTMRG